MFEVGVQDRFYLESVDVYGDNAAAVGFVVGAGFDVDFSLGMVAAVGVDGVWMRARL